MTSRIPLFQIDSFADRAFGGNPAAVCILKKPATPEWMQAVAAEMNLSETAFVCRNESGYSLRWFTPQVEVDLCGHGTLAAAHALWESGVSREQPLNFSTLSGPLEARRDGRWIELNFPLRSWTEIDPPVDLVDALGLPAVPRYAAKTDQDYLLQLDSAQTVRELAPDFAALARLAEHGVMVTSASDDPAYDCISRYFAPRIGINEDPVTGSAHCTIGPLWADRLKKKNVTAYQASARGGVLRLTIDEQEGRVRIAGQAVTVFRGDLLI